jgi:hypothetical protein
MISPYLLRFASGLTARYKIMPRFPTKVLRTQKDLGWAVGVPALSIQSQTIHESRATSDLVRLAHLRAFHSAARSPAPRSPAAQVIMERSTKCCCKQQQLARDIVATFRR